MSGHESGASGALDPASSTGASDSYVTKRERREREHAGEDHRLTRARECVAATARYPDPAWHAMNDLLAFADERLRINVGLVAENALLRKQAREHRCGQS